MRDNVSWAEMAFGQSMRSTVSHHMHAAVPPKVASGSSSFKPPSN